MHVVAESIPHLYETSFTLDHRSNFHRSHAQVIAAIASSSPEVRRLPMNNCRFTLDERRRVIDAVNLANSGKGYCHEGDSEDDRHLRQRVLMVLLGEKMDKL